MKDNAKKILLLLHTPDTQQPLSLTYDHLRLFLPRLTSSGLRSLVTVMRQQGYLEVERVLDQTYVRATPLGKQAVEREYVLLAAGSSAGNAGGNGAVGWATLVFLDAPPGDKQFRYLRSLLVKYRAISLTRGVYIYPFQFPPALVEECMARYAQSVVLGQLTNWVIGDDRGIAISHFQILDLVQTYSGISKEMQRLIDRKKLFRALNDQEKQQLYSLFDRMHASFQEDYGLIPIYFPQLIGGPELLAQLQSLLR